MARTEKKSRIRGLPPKLFLQTVDSHTGSFPSKFRTAVSDNRTGNYKVAFDDTNMITFASESLFEGSDHDYYIFGLNINKSYMGKPIFSESLGADFTSINSSSFITSQTGSIHAGISDTFLLPVVALSGGQAFTPYRDNDHPAIDGQAQNNPFYTTGSLEATYGINLEQPLWSKSKIEIDLTSGRVHSFGIQNYLSTSQNFPMAYWNKDAKVYEGIGPGTEFAVYSRGSSSPLNADSFHELYNMHDEQTIGFAGSSATTWPSTVTNPLYYISKGAAISNFCFPYHVKYNATSSNLISMSEYINAPFIVEKVVLEFSASMNANNMNNHSGLGPTIKGGMTTFFILNQFGSQAEDVEQTVRGLYYLSSPTYQNIFLSHSIPGTYTTSGSAATNYTGPTPILKSNLLDTTRELVTYFQISTVETDTAETFRLSTIGRDYNLTGSGMSEGWTQNLIISGVGKSMRGAYPIEAESGNIIWHEDTGFFYYTETNVFGGRGGAGNDSGRSLLGTLASPQSSVTSLFGGTNTNLLEEHTKDNPYMLLPTDKLIFGWQVPMSSQYMNKGGTYVGYQGLGPQLEFGLRPSKVILYGSLIGEGKEFHDTLNQLLSSNTIHEEIG